jgi:hypothetical protein
MALRPRRPERRASTNSATSAFNQNKLTCQKQRLKSGTLAPPHGGVYLPAEVKRRRANSATSAFSSIIIPY